MGPLEEHCPDGTELIGSGTSRVACQRPEGDVVKVAFNGRGRRKNEREIEIYQDIGDPLPPVEQLGENKILMEWADPEGGESRDVRRLAKLMAEEGWWCMDLKMNNIGEYNGDIVPIDFGSCHRLSQEEYEEKRDSLNWESGDGFESW